MFLNSGPTLSLEKFQITYGVGTTHLSDSSTSCISPLGELGQFLSTQDLGTSASCYFFPHNLIIFYFSQLNSDNLPKND